MQYFGKEQESWIKLWSWYSELNDNEFNEYLKDVDSKFQNNEYIVQGEVLHVFSILLGLAKNGLYDRRIKALIIKQKENIDNLIENDLWKEKLFQYDSFSSSHDGLGYHEKESNEFKEIKKYIEEKSKIAFDDGLINKAEDLLSSYNDGNIDFVNKKLEEDFFKIAIFSKMDYKKYIKILQTTNHRNLYYIFHSYKRRYEKSRIEQNLELKDDLKFWENVNDNILTDISQDIQKLKYLRLKNFREYIKKNIIDKINELSE